MPPLCNASSVESGSLPLASASKFRASRAQAPIRNQGVGSRISMGDTGHGPCFSVPKPNPVLLVKPSDFSRVGLSHVVWVIPFISAAGPGETSGKNRKKSVC